MRKKKKGKKEKTTDKMFLNRSRNPGEGIIYGNTKKRGGEGEVDGGKGKGAGRN